MHCVLKTGRRASSTLALATSLFTGATTMRVSQAHPGLISLDRRVRPPNPLLPMVEYANRQSGKHERFFKLILQVRLLSRLLGKHDRMVQRRRRLRDMQKIDGSIPSAITFRKFEVGSSKFETLNASQFRTSPFLLQTSRVPCKIGGRVRFPSGPLNNGRAIRSATVSGC